MEIEQALAKVGVFQIHQNRRSATKHLLANQKEKEAVWFLEDEGLRVAQHFGKYRVSLSKFRKDSPFSRESLFDIHAKNGPSILYSNLLFTKHAIHRWEQRARRTFLTASEALTISDNTATKALNENMMFDDNKQEMDVFYPFGEGGFIINISRTSNEQVKKYFDSVGYAKSLAVVGNYSFDKKTKKWYGEYVPRGGQSIVKTYIGWDELKKGGTFTAADWYRENFAWQELPAEWNKKLQDMGIDV